MAKKKITKPVAKKKPTAKAKKPARKKRRKKYPEWQPMVIGPGSMTPGQIGAFSEDFNSEAKNIVARNAVTRTRLMDVAINRDALNNVDMTFSDEMKIGGDITDQAGSGTCWMYGQLNWMRIYVCRKLSIKKFQFSENFVMFWDKFEKSNYFLEIMIRMRKKPLGDPFLQHLLGDPATDGGEWHLLVNIIKKYGLVPHTVMPDTLNRVQSRWLNDRLYFKLRQLACEIRKMAAAGKSVSQLRKFKDEAMKDLYRIIAIFLGEPPKKFSWGYKDKKKKFRRMHNVTPHQFYKRACGINVDDVVAVMTSAQKSTPFEKMYTVEVFNNMPHTPIQTYLNLPPEDLKKIAIKCIKAKEPCQFSCDVRPNNHPLVGILDMSTWEYDELFGTSFEMAQGDRYDYKNGGMSHMMNFLGVDLDDGGKPLKWKVENSWGKQYCKDGWFIMKDDWFAEHVCAVYVFKKFLTPKQKRLMKQKPKVLPFWHAFG